MHILIGALVGAAFAVAITVGMSYLAGKKPVLKHVLLAALGGAISGGIASATLGAGGVAGATLTRQAVAFAAGGAAGGGGERIARNAVDRKPLHEDVAISTAVGAGAGLVSLGASRASSAVMHKVLGPSAAAASDRLVHPTLLRRIAEAPTPGTGSGFVSFFDDRLKEVMARDWIDSPTPQPAPAPPPAPSTDEPSYLQPTQPAPAKTPGLSGALGGAF